MSMARALTVTAFVLACAATRPSAAAIFTVGAMADGACTHHNLQAAILAAAAAGNDEVRLAGNLAYTNETVHLTNWSAGNALTIAGGYDNCADTSASGRTTIDGTSSPVVEVDTTGASTSTVTLRRLILTGSSARGLLVEGNSTVTLLDTAVIGNQGGGVQLTTGATVHVDQLSTVEGNSTGGNGGGIRCTDGHLLVAGIVGFPDAPNVAAINGGGIFAGAGCNLKLLDGAIVQSNQALNGGGIAAGGGATVTAHGDSFRITVNNNLAEESGGGVHAADSGTSVSLVNVGVINNRALSGGGLHSELEAQITMDQDALDCANVDDCSRLSGNTLVAAGGTAGAAAAAELAGDVDVYETFVEFNRAANPAPGSGSIFAADGTGSRIRFEGITMFLNECAHLVAVSGGAEAAVAFVTASRNGRSNPAFATPATPLFVGAGADATLHSSIFWPNSPFVVEPGATLAEVNCLIVSNPAGLPAGATLVHTVDPQFRDGPSGNLRPGPFSPAIDFCDASQYPPTHQDRDGESRGFDLPFNPNGSPGLPGGTFDLGADEVRDFVFYDGFEGGNTGAWSAKWP
jgi:predicted outer membrane repeat protein